MLITFPDGLKDHRRSRGQRVHSIVFYHGNFEQCQTIPGYFPFYKGTL